MDSGCYIGFRIEVANKYIVKNFVSRVNSSKNKKIRLVELRKDGKITIEKKDNMLIVHGVKADVKTGLTNFSLLAYIEGGNETDRIVKIINVLGNDRLIREKVSLFVHGKSILNDIPELSLLKTTLLKIERMSPGFILNSWYYAPEAMFE